VKLRCEQELKKEMEPEDATVKVDNSFEDNIYSGLLEADDESDDDDTADMLLETAQFRMLTTRTMAQA
jgi:hypothetical protein